MCRGNPDVFSGGQGGRGVSFSFQGFGKRLLVNYVKLESSSSSCLRGVPRYRVPVLTASASPTQEPDEIRLRKWSLRSRPLLAPRIRWIRILHAGPSYASTHSSTI